MNQEPTLHVAFVEDNPGDAELVRHHLRSGAFAIDHSERLSDAVTKARIEKPDVALLDLNLPDSDGLQTVDRFLKEVPGVPIVVLTVLDNEEMGAAAVDMGAQDYLVKEDVQAPLLTRALRFAVLRHATIAAEERKAGSLADEVRRLRALLTTQETADREPLRNRAPQAFAEIVERFRERAAEDRPDVRGGIVMARMMADLGAGPRDVMDAYARVVELAQRDSPDASATAREETAARTRMCALELMGRLVELYGSTGTRGRGLVGRERTR